MANARASVDDIVSASPSCRTVTLADPQPGIPSRANRAKSSRARASSSRVRLFCGWLSMSAMRPVPGRSRTRQESRTARQPDVTGSTCQRPTHHPTTPYGRLARLPAERTNPASEDWRQDVLMDAGVDAEVNERFPVVALVSSAGGMDALSQVLTPLPPSFPAALIALQHTSPRAPGILADILARRTALPVRFADDGDPLLPGQVLVIPPAVHMLVGP